MQQFGDPGIAQSAPAFAPDGQRLAFAAVVDGNTDLWILDITSGAQQRLTFEPIAEGTPAWSPSGDQIAFTSVGTEISIKIIPSDGAGEAKIVAEVAWLPNFSPDGNTLAFVQADAALNPGLWYRELQGASEPVLFLEAGLWDESPRISPDGRFIAYSSDELGSMEVYVRPFPKGDGRWQVSLGGGRTPAWSPSGDRLYYLQGDDLMEAAVQVRPTVSIDTPRKLFTWPFPPVLAFDFTPLFDVDPDGESFVMVEDTQPGAAWGGIVIVENWIAEFGE